MRQRVVGTLLVTLALASARCADDYSEPSMYTGNSTPDMGEQPARPAKDPREEPTADAAWFELSTDDSTSMASAQLFKGGSTQGLLSHEFVNYYDPPRSLFDSEPWARTAEVTPEIHVGVSAVLDPEDETRMRVLFQMRADPVSRDTRRPWRVVLCVDTSGSMSGDDKIGFVRNALTQSLAHFREGDRLSLVTFSDDAHSLFEALDPVLDRNAILRAFGELAPDASTNMIAGLELAYGVALEHYDAASLNRVVLFGDGMANVGDTTIDSFASLTRIQNSEGIYLSSVGVGYDFAWERMDRLADAGKGASIFLPNAAEVDLMFGDYFPKLIEVAADKVSIALTLPAGTVLEGFSGEEVSTDPNQHVASIILAAGDDITFTAVFTLPSAEAIQQPARLEVELRPLSTAENQTTTIELAQLSDMLTSRGQLFERTELVTRFAQYASTNAGDVTLLRAALDAYANPDIGLSEIRTLLDGR